MPKEWARPSKMYYSYQDLVKEYVDCKISVDIDELEREGVIEDFINDVEKISPTWFIMSSHQAEYLKYKRKYSHCGYFSLYRMEDSTYPVYSFRKMGREVGHLLVEDIPPIDMESLLAE